MCSTPAARSRDSFAAISSGVPNIALSAAASSVWSNDSMLDLLLPSGVCASFASRGWLASRASMALALSSAFFAT